MSSGRRSSQRGRVGRLELRSKGWVVRSSADKGMGCVNVASKKYVRSPCLFWCHVLKSSQRSGKVFGHLLAGEGLLQSGAAFGQYHGFRLQIHKV